MSEAGQPKALPGDASLLAGAALPLRGAALAALGLAYFGAASIPLPSGLNYQAYLFWPAAAVAHTALFVLGPEAVLGILAGSLALNLHGWLPWPAALGMVALQTLEPFLAWRILVQLGHPRPDPGRLSDLLPWLGVATVLNATCSALSGTVVVGYALPSGFHDPMATALSWFLGDFTAILCLGPLLLQLGRRSQDPPLRSRVRLPWWEAALVAGLGGLLLATGRLQPDLSRDFRLAFQFALVLPLLWMALRLGPRVTAAGTALLALAFLGSLWSSGRVLPEEAFRFSQVFLLVLALAAHVTAAAQEGARRARLELGHRDLQAQRMEAVGTLAGGLVHEFNNQLTVLLGNLDRLRDQVPPSSDSAPMLDRMEEAATALEGTVRHLRDLSHQAPILTSRVDLQDAVAPFLVGLRNLPDRLAFESQVHRGLLVSLDPDALRQVLQVLLDNSIDAIEGPGRIRLAALREGDSAVLSLEDTGRGMSPEVLQRACDPFFSTKPVGAGRGLGLSVAFSLVRQMGGSLALDSLPGRGTQAELRFPLALSPEPSASGPVRPTTRKHVLLADDEAAIRELTRECLEAEGFTVQEAADGLEALDAFEQEPDRWDLVILDLVMPRMHGVEVLTRIHEARHDLPVLLVSGYSAEARPDLLQGPHRRFLAKPFRLRELLAALAELGIQGPSPRPADRP